MPSFVNNPLTIGIFFLATINFKTPLKCVSLAKRPSKKGIRMTSSKKILFSCFAGNLLEWYEFAIFGFMTHIISQQFFPSTSAFLSMMMTYAVFAIGFIIRPFGAILSGHIGDQYGRKSGLMLSIALMAMPTFLIGCLPTYEQAGVIAPLLLLLCRMIQGISLGGEFSGSVVYLIEHAPKDKPAYFASWADLGSSVGMILASLTSLLLTIYLSDENLKSFGWRLPFLGGIVFGILGYYLRRDLTETPEFKPATEKQAFGALVKKSFTASPKLFIIATTFLAINSAGYYFLVIYLPKQIMVDALPSYAMTLLPLISITAMMPATFVSAFLSDKIGQKPILYMGYLTSLALAYPTLLHTTTSHNLSLIATLHILFAISLGMCFGPRSALITKLFPTEHRYTGVSITYNIANATFGGLSPMICATMANSWGVTSPALWIIGCAIVSLVSIKLLGQRYKSLQHL